MHQEREALLTKLHAEQELLRKEKQAAVARVRASQTHAAQVSASEEVMLQGVLIAAPDYYTTG